MNKNDIEILKKIDTILDSHRNCKGLANFYDDFLKYKELVKKAELQYNNKCKRALKYKHNNKEILNIKYTTIDKLIHSTKLSIISPKNVKLANSLVNH